jgi:N utilization substance protein B
MLSIRRRARIATLQALYEIDCIVHHEAEAILTRLMMERELPQDSIEFASELIKGVLSHKQELDDIIGRFAPAFPVEQLSSVDRNILRIAIFEILFNNKAPVKAVINEAVELAKTFGSESSPRFVNGVLGSLVASLVERERETNRKE